MEERERLILFPVRRRLAVLCSAYLLGIYGAQIVAVPAAAFVRFFADDGLFAG